MTHFYLCSLGIRDMNFDLFGRSSQGERELFLFVILEIQNIQYKFWDEKSIKCLARYFFFCCEEKSFGFHMYMYTCIFYTKLSYSGGSNSLNNGNDHPAFLMFCVTVLSPHL